MILLTGGSGLLGSKLIEFFQNIESPAHKDLDITKEINKKQYELIIHAAAFTDLVRAEKEQYACFKTNVAGTINLINKYKDTPFVYISTEYVAYPNLNYYSKTVRIFISYKSRLRSF